MNQWFLFGLMSLATNRITRLLTTDDFPPILTARTWLLNHFDESPWGKVFICGWCMSLWVASGLVAVMTQLVDVPLPALQVFAIAGASGLLQIADQE